MRLPSKVLRLGTLIVRELDLERSNDTLGRWMAHHLAELIAEAEGDDGDDRTETRGRIFDLILRIWSHRRSLPQNADPLSKLEDLVSVLWRLRPEASPFVRMGSNETEDLLARAFGRFQRVVVYGILLTAGLESVPEKVEEFEPFLDEHERELIETMRRWMESFSADLNRVVRIEIADEAPADTSSCEEEADARLDAKAAPSRLLVEELDELIELLSSLKSRLVAEG